MPPRYSEDEARVAIAASFSWAEALTKLGMRPAGGNGKTLQRYAREVWGISTDHFDQNRRRNPQVAAGVRARARRDAVAAGCVSEDTSVMAEAGMHRTIPALPVREMVAAVAFYVERFGFEVLHHDGGFAVLRRDEAVLHLWESGDEGWRSRADFGENPVCSGAESFIAGTASTRIEVADVDGLYEELRAAEVLHPVSRDGVDDTDFGTREFATLDQDGNLLGFFRWVER